MPRVYFRPPSASIQTYVTSFLGFMDIKVGSQILTLFSLFNKIAGIYGIIAIFQGGTVAQLSLYIYSIATIPVFIWGLKAISDVRASTYPGKTRRCSSVCPYLYLGPHGLDRLDAALCVLVVCLCGA